MYPEIRRYNFIYNDCNKNFNLLMERADGIEPPSSVWKTDIIPLYDARNFVAVIVILECSDIFRDLFHDFIILCINIVSLNIYTSINFGIEV